MREIKFRGMNLCGSWVYGDLTHERMRMPDGKLQKYISVCGEPIHPKFVGQFTGLKDPTGKEIYEGDILECLALDDGPFVVRVVFRNGAFHTDVHDGVNGANFTCLLADLFALGEVRIVGNIWDGYPKFVSIEGIGGFEK